RTFFQANKVLIGDLIDAALGGATGEMAFDLYSGVGLFTVPMARQFTNVIAVEGNTIAAEFAKKNAVDAGLDNIKVSNRSVDDFLLNNKTRDVDMVLIDPPRSGTEKQTIAAIAKLRPKQIS